MLDMIEMQLPCATHGITILRDLACGQFRVSSLSVMQWNRKNIRRAIRKPDTRPRQRNLHDLTREVARRMRHALIGGRDASPGGVIISAEMRRHTASLRGHR